MPDVILSTHAKRHRQGRATLNPRGAVIQSNLVDAHCVKQAKNEEHALDIELEK